MPKSTPSRAPFLLFGLLALVAVTVGLFLALKSRGAGGGGDAERLARARVLASVHYVNSRLEDPRSRDESLRAVDEAEECVKLAPKSAVDRLNLAIALLRSFDEKKLRAAGTNWIDETKPAVLRAEKLIEEVRKERPDLAAAPFHAAMAAVRRGKLEAADASSDWEAKLREAGEAYLRLEDRSGSLRYHLGALDFRAGRFADAERSLRRAVEIDRDHPNAYNLLALSLVRQGQPRESVDPLFERHKMLQDTIGKARKEWDPDAVYDPAFPELVAAGDASALRTPVDGATRFEPVESPVSAALLVPILRGDPATVAGALSPGADAAAIARARLLAWPHAGAAAFVGAPNEVAPKLDGAAPLCAFSGDFDADHYLDLVVGTERGLAALRARGPRPEDGFEPLAFPGTEGLGRVGDVVAADLDSDGDLDLMVLDGNALRVFRNDAEPRPAPEGTPAENLVFVPRFTDVTAASGLKVDASSSPVRLVLLDYDDRNDADLLVVGKSGSTLFANRRGWRFEAVAQLPGAEDGAAGDVDGDGLTDVVLASPAGVTLHRSNGRTLEAGRPLLARKLESPRLALLDTENRGSLDVICFARDAAHILRLRGSDGIEELAPRFLAGGFKGTPLALAATDLDGDFRLDLAVAREGAPALLLMNRGSAASRALAVTFRGTKTNRAGIGTKVEARAGGLRARREAWTLPVWIAVGPHPRVDGLFLKWTNGIDEASGDVPTGRYRFELERLGREGSCPFVFSWNGERFEFITDAIGATPLGLYAAPGIYVPPQDREWLRIRGDQLRPKEGAYEIRFTEEMREITYLDRVRLVCVDHPEGTTVYPDERFCFPPFPEKRLLTVRREIPLAAARMAGRDVSDLLAREDRRFTAPPERLPYQGMSTEHALELDLGDLKDAPSLRLFLTGWFAWTNSSINRAIADAGIRFSPPRVDALEAGNTWRTVVPDAGFPAGMQKTMCIDLAGKLRPGEHVVRLVTNLELHWDRAFTSTDDAPVELRTTELAPSSAILRRHGASRWKPVAGNGPAEPLYEDAVAEQVYDLHVGDVTRYGDVRELLDAADDRFVIFPHGDEVALRFDAPAPPPVGWTRTFILDSSGWAKDRDPNTFAPDTVEPLPFHGMSGYPYGAGERYPDDAVHARYRAAWNTRRIERARPLPILTGIEAIHAR